MNGLCPECKNPPQYHSFCTLCCQLFHVPKARTAKSRTSKPKLINWRSPELQRRAADLSAEGLSASKIAAAFGIESISSVKSAMWRLGLFAQHRKRRGRKPACEVVA